MNPKTQFNKERRKEISEMSKDKELKRKSLEWMVLAHKWKYNYNFTWLGRPIIKYPNDIILMQELIWKIKPDLIVDVGIAHGGSIIFCASLLELIGKGEVIGIDIDIREHNKCEIEKHPMIKRIRMIEGSSISKEIISELKKIVKNIEKVMVFLDSNHTHNHVLKELELYSSFVTIGSYIVVSDTLVEYFPKGYFSDRPWDVGNNPLTAIREFLSKNDNFKIDHSIDKK
jgi:cephalosporin hydroxylase